MHPFSADQLDAALQTVSRLQPAADAAAHELAKICAVMPAKGAVRSQHDRLQSGVPVEAPGSQANPAGGPRSADGTLSFLLKIKSIYSFLDALQRSRELDADLVAIDGDASERRRRAAGRRS